METHQLILPEDLNQYGFLFGGRLLSWVDKAAWIAASLDFPHCHFVTIAMDRVEFRHTIPAGSIISIQSEKIRLGNTSITYQIHVWNRSQPHNSPLFSTQITFVNVNSLGQKSPIPQNITP